MKVGIRARSCSPQSDADRPIPRNTNGRSVIVPTEPTSTAETAASAHETGRTAAVDHKDMAAEVRPSHEVFLRTFEPKPKTDYSWALAREKEQYAFIHANLDLLDAKALLVVNHFGSGTGILAFATVLGLASESVHIGAWTGAAILPAFALAIASILFAVKARTPRRGLCAPPTGENGTRQIDWYLHQSDGSPEGIADAAKRAEYAQLPSWHYANVENFSAWDCKAILLMRSLQLKSASIAALILPLIAAIAERFAK